MKILALILARGGSKRIPGKNIRMLGGKPLIQWSIDIVKGIPAICDILVSTDDEEIAKVAQAGGAKVPWLRPAELSSDTASSVDATLHALDFYEKQYSPVDGVLLLQPTSPFRNKQTVIQGLELFEKNSYTAVIGVSPTENHPMHCFKIEDGRMIPFIQGTGLQMRSQDLPPAYIVNGSFYLIHPSVLREKRTFFSANSIPLISEDIKESVDIDTEQDWRIAELFYSNEL